MGGMGEVKREVKTERMNGVRAGCDFHPGGPVNPQQKLRE